MAQVDRLLRANRTLLLLPVYDGPVEPLLVGVSGTTCPMSAPTSAVVNSWIGVTSTTATGAQNGGNISCATLDDVKLGLAASDTDTELTVCSVGNEQTPTFHKVDMDFSGLRDASQSDTGVFNLFTQLMNARGTRYVIVDRVGYASTAAVASGQDMSFYEAYTDNPVDTKADRANLKIANTPVPTGNVNTRYTLLS